MSIRIISLTALMILSLSACQKEDDEPAAADPAPVTASAPVAAEPAAAPDAQSVALQMQDATAALVEAASEAVDMVTDASKK